MLKAFREKWVTKEIGDSPSSIKRLFLQRPTRSPHARPLRDLDPAFSARSSASVKQVVCLLFLGMGAAVLWWRTPAILHEILYWLMWTAFMGNAILRLAACAVPVRTVFAETPASNENLPTYSVIVALYKEAAIVPQLLAAMLSLRYPIERLEILFALEADDRETIDAFHAQDLPPHVHIIEVPEGFPRTKPRALNHALTFAHGELIVIYDAEDRPHPDQLLRAAVTFNDGPANLACLQAPLRPVGGKGFVARQFALEYAVQFDVLLPAMNALGLPFPLGGTSNHFKTEVLKAIGGWDAFNVTEDADLGLRLAQYDYSLGLINAPTFETPPSTTRAWIPQRTRWIKGYMQTLLVHTRLTTRLKIRAWISLIIGVGLSAAAAICYAPFTCLLLMSLLLMGLQTIIDPTHTLKPIALRDVVLFATGTFSAMLTLASGARRAGLRLSASDVASAPAYWSLQSLAAGFALYQLVTRPFHWDKTEHLPDTTHKPLYEGAPGDYGQDHDHNRHSNNPAHQGVG